MSYSTLVTSLIDGIYTITINRPEKLNALNSIVLSELEHAIDEIYSNPLIKSAIITGTGSKAFVAGADISEFSDLTKAEAIKLSKRGQDIFFKIEKKSSRVGFVTPKSVDYKKDIDGRLQAKYTFLRDVSISKSNFASLNVNIPVPISFLPNLAINAISRANEAVSNIFSSIITILVWSFGTGTEVCFMYARFPRPLPI